MHHNSVYTGTTGHYHYQELDLTQEQCTTTLCTQAQEVTTVGVRFDTGVVNTITLDTDTGPSHYYDCWAAAVSHGRFYKGHHSSSRVYHKGNEDCLQSHSHPSWVLGETSLMSCQNNLRQTYSWHNSLKAVL